MAMTIHIDIVSAEGSIYSGTAEEVFAPAEMGDLGILPRHSPLVARLKAGEVRVKPQGQNEEEVSIFVSGGIIEVLPHVVTILADTGMRAQDLDEAKALEAKEKAEKALSDQKGGVDLAQAQAELIAASAQIHFIKQLKKRRR